MTYNQLQYKLNQLFENVEDVNAEVSKEDFEAIDALKLEALQH